MLTIFFTKAWQLRQRSPCCLFGAYAPGLERRSCRRDSSLCICRWTKWTNTASRKEKHGLPTNTWTLVGLTDSKNLNNESVVFHLLDLQWWGEEEEAAEEEWEKNGRERGRGARRRRTWVDELVGKMALSSTTDGQGNWYNFSGEPFAIIRHDIYANSKIVKGLSRRFSKDIWVANNVHYLDVQLNLSLGKCKSNSQWDTTLCSLQWQSSPTPPPKKKNIKCWWGCGETRTLVHRWWESKMAQLLKKTVWGVCRKLKIELPYNPPISLMYIPERTERWDSNSYLYPHVYGSIICNSQKVETV